MQTEKKLYRYIAVYKGKIMEIYAESSYAAQQKAAIEFKAKKAYEITVVLAEKDGTTIQDELKKHVLEIARSFVQSFEEDIESGIEEGTYKESENVETRKQIRDAYALFDAFEASKPDVYVLVEGGKIQGVSATCSVGFEAYDPYDYTHGSEEEREYVGTPEEWEEMIKEKTDKNEIKGVF